MKIGPKIILGFAAALALAVVLALIAYRGLGNIAGSAYTLIDRDIPAAKLGMETKRVSLMTRQHERNYLYTRDKKYIDLANKGIADVRKILDEGEERAKVAKQKEALDLVAQAHTSVDNYERVVKSIVKNFDEEDALVKDIEETGVELATIGEQITGEYLVKIRERVAEAEEAAKKGETVAEGEEGKVLATKEVERYVGIIEAATGVQMSILQARRLEKEYRLTLQKRLIDAAEDNLKVLKDWIKKLNELVDVEYRSRITTLSTALEKYATQLRDTAANKEAEVKMAEELQKYGLEIETLGDKYAGLNWDIADETAAQAKVLVAGTNRMLWITVFAVIVLGLVLGVVISRAIVNPLGRLLTQANAIAGGDLTQVVEIKGNDEVAQMGSAFQTMLKTLNETIGRVQSSSVQVVQATGEISSGAEQIASGTQKQAQQAVETASAMEEMAQTVKVVADNANKAMEAAKKAIETTDAGSKTVAEASSAMERVRQAVLQSSERIGGLTERAKAVQAIVTTIDSIAAQTNLLALNAAIESAGAGEAGRRFDVVAEEVRKLAERTTQATDEATKLVTAVGEETDATVKVMAAGTKEVETGAQLAKQASDSLVVIRETAQGVTKMIEAMQQAAEQQTKMAEEVSATIESISKGSQQTATTTEQAAKAAEQVTKIATELQQTIAQFKILGAQAQQAAAQVAAPAAPKAEPKAPLTHLAGLRKREKKTEPGTEKKT